MSSYFNTVLWVVLVKIFIAMKRHYDQGNSFEMKHLIGSLLTVSEAVLVRISIAVKRHHGNSYEGKHLIGAGL